MMVFLVAGLFLGSIEAQSNALGVRPKIDVTVNPGDTIEETAFIRNPSQEAQLRVSIEKFDFKAKNETGSPEFLLSSDERTPYSAQDFIVIDESAAIEPGKSLSVPFTITVPADQGAGTYYTSIRFSALGDNTNQVNLQAANTTLVFVRVPGDTKELLQLEKFGAFVSDGKDGGTYKSFFTSEKPVRLAYTVRNEGNVAEEPKGSIIIKDVFGKTVETITDANLRNELALLGQTRRFELCLREERNNENILTGTCEDIIKFPGRYTAEMTVLYGENGAETREISAKATFWYLPMWFMVAAGIVLALIILAVVMIVFKVRNGRYGNKIRR